MNQERVKTALLSPVMALVDEKHAYPVHPYAQIHVPHQTEWVRHGLGMDSGQTGLWTYTAGKYRPIIPSYLPLCLMAFQLSSIISHVWKSGNHTRISLLLLLSLPLAPRTQSSGSGSRSTSSALRKVALHSRIPTIAIRSHDALFGIFSSVDSSLGPCNHLVNLPTKARRTS